MKKLLFLLILLAFPLLSPQKAYAQTLPDECGFKIVCVDPSEPNCKYDNDPLSTTLFHDTKEAKFTFNLNTVSQEIWKKFPDENKDGKPDIFTRRYDTHPDDWNWCWGNKVETGFSNNLETSDTRSSIDTICKPFKIGNHSFSLEARDNNDAPFELCKGYYDVVNRRGSAEIKVFSTNQLYDINSNWNVEITNVLVDGIRGSFSINLDGNSLNDNWKNEYIALNGNLGAITNHSDDTINGKKILFSLKPLPEGNHSISVNAGVTSNTINSITFEVLKLGAPPPTITPSITPILPTPTDSPICAEDPCNQGGNVCNTNPDCKKYCSFCNKPSPTPKKSQPKPVLTELCNQLPGKDSGSCWECQKKGKLWTAIGCVPTNLNALFKDYLFTLGLGIAGGIAFLYFLYGIFLIQTSAGEAEKVAEGKEIIVSALSGLLLIIFSVFLLRVIGVDILRIPGFK